MTNNQSNGFDEESDEIFDSSSLLLNSAIDRELELAVESVSDADGLASFVKSRRAELIEQARHSLSYQVNAALPPRSAIELSRGLSDLIDAVVRRMFVMACTVAQENPATVQIAIVATGGYGRRELSPFSDIDITFIPVRDGDSRLDRVIRELFRLVMDVFIARCGLEVGYAYRLLSDCSVLDHQTQCGLMDARQIAGNERLFIQFESEFWLYFNAAEFIFTKIDERNGVLKKWGTLTRGVEPHLKEGPGGLRDLHMAVWLLQAREHLVAARARGDRGIALTRTYARFTDAEVQELQAAKEFLFKVRCVLHAVAGAERDQLVVTRQEDVAVALGYGREDLHSATSGSTLDIDSDIDTVPAVELFMADLFPALSIVRRASERVIRNVLNSKLLVGIGLDCVGGEVVMANRALDSYDPVWLVWACEYAQRYSQTLSDEIESKAIDIVKSRKQSRCIDQVAAAFLQILTRMGRIYPILQRMADLGILQWIIPEFDGLMNLIPYDASHDFTIGQHTLLVIKYIEGLLVPDGSEEQADMRRALQDLPHPEYLIMAALLHDTGKATPGIPHAQQSALIVDAVCSRLGWSEEATAHVRFLALNHLLMGETARLKDLNMDQTIRDFVQVVDDPDRLNMLYLLTYADTRAVGEGIWTPVRGKFLRELWLRSSSALYMEEDAAENSEAHVAAAVRKIKKDLSLQNYTPEEIEEHIAAMPPYYLLNTSQQEVAQHLGYLRRVRNGEIVVECHDERITPCTELTICTYDDPTPGLLAKIAVALFASSLNVHSAHVVTRATTQDTIALDTLLVDFKGKPLSTGKRQEVSANLRALISGTKSAEALLTKSPLAAAKKSTRSAQSVRSFQVDGVSHAFDHAVSMIELSGPATPEMFYRVCASVSSLGLDIKSAKLSESRDTTHVSLYVNGARSHPESDIKRRVIRALEAVARSASQ